MNKLEQEFKMLVKKHLLNGYVMESSLIINKYSKLKRRYIYKIHRLSILE